MKSFIIILSISLMPFAALAEENSSWAARSSEPMLKSSEPDGFTSALWAELAFKSSILSAISVMESTNKAIGGFVGADIEQELAFAVPIVVGSLALTSLAATTVKMNYLPQSLNAEELKIVNKYKQDYEWFNKPVDYANNMRKSYLDAIRAHPLRGSDFVYEINALDKSELAKRNGVFLREIDDKDKRLKQAKNKYSESSPVVSEAQKELNQLKAQRGYIILRNGLLEHERNFKSATARLNEFMKSESTAAALDLQNRFLLRRVGLGGILLAGTIAYTFIIGDAVYIALSDEQASHIKEQYSEDIKNLKRVLL